MPNEDLHVDIFQYSKLVGKPVIVSQKVVVFNSEGKVLTIRKSSTAPFHPNTWDLPGGELEYGEDAYEGIARESFEETGLHIRECRPIDVESSFYNTEYWVTIAYKAKCGREDTVSLSYEHDAFKWVAGKEFMELDAAPYLKRFVRKAYDTEINKE